MKLSFNFQLEKLNSIKQIINQFRKFIDPKIRLFFITNNIYTLFFTFLQYPNNDKLPVLLCLSNKSYLNFIEISSKKLFFFIRQNNLITLQILDLNLIKALCSIGDKSEHYISLNKEDDLRCFKIEYKVNNTRSQLKYQIALTNFIHIIEIKDRYINAYKNKLIQLQFTIKRVSQLFEITKIKKQYQVYIIFKINIKQRNAQIIFGIFSNIEITNSYSPIKILYLDPLFDSPNFKTNQLTYKFAINKKFYKYFEIISDSKMFNKIIINKQADLIIVRRNIQQKQQDEQQSKIYIVLQKIQKDLEFQKFINF